MLERAREYLLSLGYSEADVEETLANATEEDLRGLIPEVPEARAKPKSKQKARQKAKPKAKAPISMPEFDPIQAAMTVIDGGNKETESNKVVRYTVTPVFKLTLCTDIDKETFNAIKAELKSLGGKWSDEIEGFWFDTDPSTLF